ncbi:MAG: outer membrane beta-barrel protein [Chitinophagaceae bacterium]
MKKILAFALVLVGTSSFAQTEKGDWMVGGNIGFRTNKNNSNFSFSPNAGYFFADRFVAGAALQTSFEKTGDIKSSTVGLGPFARYYFLNGNFKPFAVTQVNYLVAATRYNGTKTTTNGYGWLLGAGAAAFISQDVAFEGVAGYNYSQFSSASSNTGFSLNFGFQVYINKGKMASLKKGKISE